MIATAESCTGGMIAAALTGIAGSSAVVERGFVTYTNEAKSEMLGVPASLIETHGAVSEPVARAMAEGALRHSGADLAVSVTGIAGPGGATPTKPVGLVHLAVARKGGETRADHEVFKGDRTDVREAATARALDLLLQTLKDPTLPDSRPADGPEHAPVGITGTSPRSTSGRVLSFDIRYWEVLAVLAASLLFAVLVATVTGTIMGGFEPGRAKTLAKSETFALTVLGLSTVGMFVWAHLIIVMRRRMSWRDFGFKRIGQWTVLAALGIGVLAMPVMALTGAAVQRLLGRPLGSPQLQFLAPDGFSWTIVVGMILIGGLLAPVAEEIIFRGLLYGWLRRFMGLAPAAFLSAAVFGLVHGILPVIAAAFVVGLALAYIYERTGSLWAPTIVHATQNCIAMTIMFANLK